MIWIADTENKGIYFNREWLTYTGRTIEQELGDGWGEGVHPDDVEESLRTCAEAVAARKNIEMEFRLRGADGQYRWFLDHGVPIYSSGGEFLGYIGTSVDVTQRRENQEMLLRSERLAAIGEAMAGLSHESRNALQRSQSSLERLSLRFDDQPEALTLIPEAPELLDACRESPRVVVRWKEAATENGGHLYATISDNGHGVPASERARIFDAFRTTKARGTGLGLAITRRLIEAHDGRISAGDSPDGGAEFSICLPRQLRVALPG
jgi:PAS domain S-box-containing protein